MLCGPRLLRPLRLPFRHGGVGGVGVRWNAEDSNLQPSACRAAALAVELPSQGPAPGCPGRACSCPVGAGVVKPLRPTGPFLSLFKCSSYPGKTERALLGPGESSRT